MKLKISIIINLFFIIGSLFVYEKYNKTQRRNFYLLREITKIREIQNIERQNCESYLESYMETINYLENEIHNK